MGRMAAMTRRDKSAITVRTLFKFLDTVCLISCIFEASFLAFCTWFLTWGQCLCCTDSFRQQVVRNVDNEQARSICAWCISGHDEGFRVVVTKIGGSVAPPVAFRHQVLPPPAEKYIEPVKGSLIADPTHLPISSGLLLSKPSHLGWKREGKE